MSKLGVFDIRFLTFVNRKYSKRFKTFDDYLIYLLENICGNNVQDYQYELEEDVRSFVKWQEEKMSKW